MNSVIQKIGIIGAGAWGTALSLTARRAGRETLIWAYEEEVADSINSDNENPLYLPGVRIDPEIRATTDLAAAADSDALLLAVPAQRLRGICNALKDATGEETTVVICCKGIEQETGALMSEVAVQALPAVSIAVMSGPTFAAEVASDLPTAVTLACGDGNLGESLSTALGSPTFRIYRSDDLIGAQVGGAVKNVLAIACGIVEGRKMGDNARAALITRGLAEIVRLGLAKGGRAETLMGLSGLGDVTLTCNAMQSRNFSLGVALGEGRPLDEILGQRKSVAEGVFTAASASRLAKNLNVEMPITVSVDAIINHFADIDATIAGILSRPLKVENPAQT